MSYSTIAEVKLALAPFDAPTPTNSAADLPDDQIQDAIDQADSIIDSMIGGFYVVPVASTGSEIIVTDPPTDETILIFPHPIDWFSRDVAAYLATLSYMERQDITATDPIQLRYNIAWGLLVKIQAGKATLQIPALPSGDPGAMAGAGSPINTYPGKLFEPSDWDLRPRRDRHEGWPMPGWGRGFIGGGSW